MEVLSRLLEKVVDAGEVSLHPQCDDPRIMHLLFANDLLIFTNGSRSSLRGVRNVLMEFKL